MPYRTQGQQTSGRGPGGTSGGVGQFVIGLAMLVAGSYLFLNNVIVSSHGWGGIFSMSQGAFGLSLIPFFVGVAFLFFNGTSKVGWFLTFAGVIIIFVGVIARLDIHFRRISLFDTLLIFVLMAGGLGLLARSLKAQ